MPATTSSSRECSRSSRPARSSIGPITIPNSGTRRASSSSAARDMSESLTDIGLASISPRRLSLLQSLGLRVTVVKSAYDENAQTGDAIAAAELAQRHAEGKAERATADGPRLLVAADTIVDV